MAINKKTSKQGRPRKKPSKRRRKGDTGPGQTNQPFAQDSKRRIGQYSGAGETPLMKK
jgi:hypothetical protein